MPALLDNPRLRILAREAEGEGEAAAAAASGTNAGERNEPVPGFPATAEAKQAADATATRDPSRVAGENFRDC